jgi:hypothetical protein
MGKIDTLKVKTKEIWSNNTLYIFQYPLFNGSKVKHGKDWRYFEKRQLSFRETHIFLIVYTFHTLYDL